MSSENINLKKLWCCRCSSDEDACRIGHTKCLKKFLRLGTSNPNRKISYNKQVVYDGDDYESTVCVETSLLHMGCKKGNGDCVAILLKDERVDPNILNGNDETPLQMICISKTKFNKDPIIELLLQDPRVIVNTPKYKWPTKSISSSPFYCYVYYKSFCSELDDDYNLTIVKLFLEKGAQIVSDKDHYDDSSSSYHENIFKTLCYVSTKKNLCEVIKLLLESGKVPKSSVDNVKEKLRMKSILKVIDEWENSALDIKEPNVPF
jgi:ankyrin repeat protein